MPSITPCRRTVSLSGPFQVISLLEKPFFDLLLSFSASAKVNLPLEPRQRTIIFAVPEEVRQAKLSLLKFVCVDEAIGDMEQGRLTIHPPLITLAIRTYQPSHFCSMNGTQSPKRDLLEVEKKWSSQIRRRYVVLDFVTPSPHDSANV